MSYLNVCYLQEKRFGVFGLESLCIDENIKFNDQYTCIYGAKYPVLRNLFYEISGTSIENRGPMTKISPQNYGA